jgi:glucose/arabinose dehydrogenase
VVDGVFTGWFDVGHRACGSVAPDSRRIVTAEPIGGVPAVHTGSQAGLFDIVLHPNFAQNNVVYLTFAAGTKAANGTQVARARFDGSTLQDLQVIFKAMPLKDTDNHYGGRMAFLPDGTFTLTIGEGFEYREKAQDLTSDLGKIVRLNEDGRCRRIIHSSDRLPSVRKSTLGAIATPRA